MVPQSISFRRRLTVARLGQIRARVVVVGRIPPPKREYPAGRRSGRSCQLAALPPRGWALAAPRRRIPRHGGTRRALRALTPRQPACFLQGIDFSRNPLRSRILCSRWPRTRLQRHHEAGRTATPPSPRQPLKQCDLPQPGPTLRILLSRPCGTSRRFLAQGFAWAVGRVLCSVRQLLSPLLHPQAGSDRWARLPRLHRR
jgi:hypothetical protein